MLRSNRLGTQIARGLFAIGSSTLYFFYGLATASLASAAAIGFTAPPMALSGPALGKSVGPHRRVAVVVGLYIADRKSQNKRTV